MIPASFDYVRPKALEDALAQLREHGEDARVLSGGHSLLPVMKARLADPGVLIDIAHIEGLSGITESEGGVRIGAMTTHAEIENSSLVQEKCRALAEAAGSIGDVQVRNRGTLGGSLAHADPAADYPAAVLAAGAEITARARMASALSESTISSRARMKRPSPPARFSPPFAYRLHPDAAAARISRRRNRPAASRCAAWPSSSRWTQTTRSPPSAWA